MFTDVILEEIAILTQTSKADVEAKFKTETGEFKSDTEQATELKNLFVGRIAKAKEEVRGEEKRKTMTAFEKDLKKAFSYDGSEQGLELQKKIVEIEKQKALEDIQKPDSQLPDFTAWKPQDWAKIGAFNEKVKEVTTDLTKKIEQVQQEYEAKETARVKQIERGSKKTFLRQKLEALKAVIPANESKDKLIDSFFENEFNLDKIKIDGQNVQFLDENDDPILDDRHLPITAEAMLKTKWWLGFNDKPEVNPAPAPNGSNSGSGIDNDMKTALNSIFQKKGDIVGYINSLPHERKAAAREYWSLLNK